MSEALYTVGFLPHEETKTVIDIRSLTWPALAEILTAHNIRETKKSTPCWAPGIATPGTRKDSNATPWNLLPIDVEQKGGAVPPTAKSVADAAALWGLKCAIATTFGHEIETPRYRVIVVPSQPLKSKSEILNAAHKVASILGFAGCVDEQATNPARLFFLPACPPGRRADAESYILDGDCFDVGAPASAAAAGIESGAAVGSGKDPLDNLPSSPALPPSRKNWSPAQVERLLRLIDPDQEYDRWFRTLAAVHHELGAEAGRAVALAWCATGGKFEGERDFDNHWRSLGKRRGGLVTTGAHLLREAYPDGLPTWDHIGNARRISRHLDGELMRVAETGQWFHWCGDRWYRVTEPEVEDMGRAVVEDMPAQSFLYPHLDTQKKYLAWCTKSANRGWVPAMETLGAMPHVRVNAEALDNEPHLLGVKNGAVDLRTGQLLQAEPGRRLTLCAGAAYDPSATCPTFERVLSDVFFDDPTMVAFFRRALGYSILANPREELVFIPYGRGANGKSKIFEAVGAALGDYGKTCAAETLLDSGTFSSGGGGAREDLVRLRGARLLVVSEPEEGARLRESLIKSMSGGDKITARAPYAKASIEIAPTWATWMPTNHRPIIRGDDSGIWRRICLIPFLRNFKNDPHITADLHLADKLRAEIPGILAFLVRAAGEYLRDGLGIPRQVVEASEGYRGEMDILASWIEEACDVGPTYEATSAQLWGSWREYARERGLDRYIPTETAFGRRMEQRFPVRRTKVQRYRTGIRVRDPFATIGDNDGAHLQVLQGGKA